MKMIDTDVIVKTCTIDTPDAATIVSQLQSLNDNVTAIIYLICMVIGVVVAVGIGYIVYSLIKQATY